MNVSFRFFECQLCGAISAVHVALAEEQEVECPSCGVALEGEDWLCDKDIEFPTEREKTLDPPAATTCTEQTFMAEITRLQEQVEGLTKLRDMQYEEIQRLKGIVRKFLREYGEYLPAGDYDELEGVSNAIKAV